MKELDEDPYYVAFMVELQSLYDRFNAIVATRGRDRNDYVNTLLIIEKELSIFKHDACLFKERPCYKELSDDLFLFEFQLESVMEIEGIKESKLTKLVLNL